MLKFLLVGLASGAASATLSLALVSGSVFSILLFMFAPLPIFIAAVGWNHRAGLIGAAAAGVFLFVLMGFETARGYALSIGFPSWWLGYLALLARPSGDNPDAGIDWYPIGRLVAWSSALGAALVLLTVPLAGSVDAYREALRTTFETFLRQETGTAPDAPIILPGGGDTARLTELAVLALPPLGAAVWTAISLFNLWLGGRIVRASARLVRPWPNLSALELPRVALLAFALGVLGSFIPGFGFVFGIIAAAFAIAYAALGLALIHAATAGTSGRTLILIATYLLLAVQTWTVVLLAALGVMEQLFMLRSRIAARRGSSPPTAKR